MGDGQSTVDSFPTYAALTQTQGWQPTTATPIEVDDTIDVAATRYTEGALLGVGGMGKVMLAHDARIGREVAVKELHTDRPLGPDERARFLREARVQGQLEHPSIVPVYDIDQRPDGATFFTMRRVLGRTLHAILDDLRTGDATARARYTQRELLTAFATICLTIDYAHSRGVIHRDLKPANVMLGDFGEVYVLDWGLARIAEDMAPASIDEPADRLSMPGELMGTPLYMAPEQMGDPSVGPLADVFSLGAMLFEILTLERLRDPRAIYAPPDARPSVRAPARGIAPELETICVTATEGDPAARYPSSRALHAAIVRYLEGDRDREQRRQLAAEHAETARAAVARAALPDSDFEQERTIAMRELGRALALEPTNPDHAMMLGAIIATPPRAVPQEVRDEMFAEEQMLVRSGTKHSAAANLMWFLFLPVVIAMGIRNGIETAFVLVPIGISVIIAALASRQRTVSYGAQLVICGMTLAGMAATSRMFGPLMIVPTAVAALTIVIQAHPHPPIRKAVWIMGMIALLGPLLLELVGVLPASYQFVDNTIQILPQMHDLPRTGSIGVLLAASIASLIVPSVFVARLRQALTEAQLRLHLQAWHFKRLGTG